MGIFRKKDVPSELPNLASDRLFINDKEKVQNFENKFKPLPKLNNRSANFKVHLESTGISHKSGENEQGYFKELINGVTDGTEKIDKFESWYKNKFMSKDIVLQMREYWEKKQPEILLKNMSDNLKSRLIDKTDKLHGLEKEWQEIYLNLLSKEEQIRKEEKELKASLGEFMKFLRNSKKSKKR